MSKAQDVVKRILFGRPMAHGEMEHTLLPKTIALPVFSSDPLSSNAYATQEALIVLATAGAVGLGLIVPITLAVATLLAIVVTSYRQTVKAYPTGGGAYRVSHENLGKGPGLLAASALLIDYVLTVAVSITAGVEALTSASESLHEHRIVIAFGFIAFVTLLNLRGAKESGTLFAVPTYGFVAAIYLMIGTGIAKCIGGCPQAESATMITDLQVEHTLTFFLVLKAFAAGTTALTGVEAIADGVPAFRYPQSKNAATTLSIMAALSISMFIGISWLADHTNVIYLEELEGQRSVVAQIAYTVFDGGFLFYLVQGMSAAILILAANTAYQDFPRLGSILATDDYLPHQFKSRGDRLVFSNGVIILALFAALLIYVFDAELTRLIQLYLVGVFISFTLSQTGMVVRARRLKEPGWKRGAAISAFGGTVTGTVLFVIAGTKFIGGAWIVIAATPVVMYTMYSINRHYTWFKEQLGHPGRRPVDRRPGHQNVVIFVRDAKAATARAVGYARSIRPSTIRAVAPDNTIAATWRRLAPDIELEVLEKGGSLTKRLLRYLERVRAETPQDEFLTLMVPEILKTGSFMEVLLHPSIHLLKGRLKRAPGVCLIDVPIVQEEIDPTFDEAQEPARNYVLVMVSSVTNSSLQAIEFAETLRPTDLRALYLGMDDPHESERLGDEWLEAMIPHPLELEDSPHREFGATLSRYIDQFEPNGRDRVVTIVLPEWVVGKWRHQILHNQTALVIKKDMLFRPGVIVASVPYDLSDSV